MKVSSIYRDENFVTENFVPKSGEDFNDTVSKASVGISATTVGKNKKPWEYQELTRTRNTKSFANYNMRLHSWIKQN